MMFTYKDGGSNTHGEDPFSVRKIDFGLTIKNRVKYVFDPYKYTNFLF